MDIAPYLSFNGNCEAAFRFYERCLGAQVGELFRYGGSPMADSVPSGWSDKVMHGCVTIGAMKIMGADVAAAAYDPPKGFTLSIQIQDTREAERVFRELSDDGAVVMPLARTFWAARFGMLVDRFGVPWQINCGDPAR